MDDDLLQEFIAESRETLEALSGEIVAWEAAPEDRARLDAIFRFVHTVKGSCGFLDLPRLARLSHAAEDVLAQARAGERRPDRHLVNAVLAIVDRIGELVEAIDAGIALDDSGEDMLIAALTTQAIDVAAASAAPVAARAPARSVRLSVDLLDRMMGGMSDMVLARNELARRLRDHPVDPQVDAALERMSATVADMRDTVTRTRMQKVDALFSALPRLVRDTAAALDKSVTLVVEGSQVELDREMIEVMRDPLVHIIRNAIDHGIETPDRRRALGKPAAGRLTVAARQAGNQIVLEIADDGRGIDVDRVIARLVAGGRDERDLRALSPQAQLALIFEAGLSTAPTVTSISGRGVGMDVVRASIDQIGGRIELDNAPGQGLRIHIQIPLTLSIVSTIVIRVGDQHFAVPRQVIEEIVAADNPAVRIDRVGDTRMATIRDRRLPVVDIRDLLGIAPAGDARDMLLVVGVGAGSFAIVVDDVADVEELVIKPAAPMVMTAGIYAGQTLPDSGRPMLLLDCAGIAVVAGLRFTREAPADDAADPQASAPMVRLLLFRDLDGARRAVPLGVVDRIEQAVGAAVHHVAGKTRLAIDDALIPLFARCPLSVDARISVLRLTDGSTVIGYAIDEASDIVTVAQASVPAAGPGPVAGAMLIDGEPIELIDPFWLFATLGEAAQATTAPLLRVVPDADGWMATFLAPILRSAGYRVAAEATNDEAPGVILRLEHDAGDEAAGDVPVVVLRREPGDAAGRAGIYRYDRDAVLREVRRHAPLTGKGGA